MSFVQAFGDAFCFFEEMFLLSIFCGSILAACEPPH